MKIYPDSRFVSDDEVTIALLLCKLDELQKALKTELGIRL